MMTIGNFLRGKKNEYTPLVRALRDKVVFIDLDEISFHEEENGLCMKVLILHGLSSVDLRELTIELGERYYTLYPAIGTSGMELSCHNENFLL